MRLLEDRLFAYRGYHGCRSECGIRVFAPEPTDEPGKPYLVIATELASNPGTSVTNAAEGLAWDVWCYLEKPGGGLQWVEHYPDRCLIGGRPLFKEQWDLVAFDRDPATGRFRSPRWRRVSRCEMERMIGLPLLP